MSNAGNAIFNYGGEFHASLHLDSDSAQLQLGDDNDMQVYHNGSHGTINVGTGNLTLDVAGDIALDADGGDIKFQDAGTDIFSIINNSTDVQLKTAVQDKDLIFIGNDGGSVIEAMRIDYSAGGFLGIGTTSAGRKLDVSSGGSDVPQIRASYNATNYLDLKHNLINAVSSGSNDSIQLQTGGTTGLMIDVNQKVGIGTTAPQGNLHIEGAAGASGGGILYITDADNGSTSGDALHISKSGDTAFVYNRESSGNLQLGAGNDATHLVILSGGNVGIGTTTPAVSLDVGSLTDAIRVPNGTTAQRPTAALGQFRYNTTTSQFEGYTGSWGAIGGGGDAFGTIAVSGQSNVVADQENDTLTLAAGTGITLTTTAGTDTVTIASSYILNPFKTDVFTTANASTTTFTLTGNPESEDMLLVFIEGVYQNKNSYALNTSTNVLTVDSAPGSGEEVVVHQVGKGVAGSGHTQDSFTGNGSTAAYTLSVTPITENDVFVYLDGVYQHKNTYSVSGTTLTFDTNVPNGVAIEAITPSLTEIGVPTAGSVTPAKLSTGAPTWDTGGNVTIDNNVVKSSASVTISSGSATVVASSPGSTYRTAKFTAQVTDATASEYMVSEIILIHTGSATHIAEYGQIFTGSAALGTFTADYSSGEFRLVYTRTGSNTQVVKLDISRLKV